jgi:hypothetical protein
MVLLLVDYHQFQLLGDSPIGVKQALGLLIVQQYELMVRYGRGVEILTVI